MLADCGSLPGEDDSSLSLVDVSGGQAVLEYAKHWNGWETLPSSIWLAGLSTGDTSRFKGARVQYDLQASGDYYVAERPSDDGKSSRVVAGQFSTHEEWTLLERRAQLGGRYLREVVLDGSRAVYRSDDGLTVYDLPGRAVLQTVPLPEPPVELLAVGGKYAVIALDPSYSQYRLVNLEDGLVAEPPAAPNGFSAMFFDATLSDTALLTAGTIEEGGQSRGAAILELDLPGQTWHILADYGPNPGGDPTSRALGVRGADEHVVLVSVIEPLAGTTLELLARATGERTVITTESLATTPLCALLRAGRVYWVNPLLGAIQAVDTATGETSLHAVDLPAD
jgi:hypothetical protein